MQITSKKNSTKRKPLLKFVLLAATLFSSSFLSLNAQDSGQGIQQFSLFSQHYFQSSAYNPAMTSFDELPNFYISPAFKKNLENVGQNIGFKNVRQADFNLVARTNFKEFDGGVGMSVLYRNPQNDGSDELKYMVSAQFSAAFNFSEDWKGVFGIGLGLLHYTNAYKTENQGSTVSGSYFKPNVDVGINIQNDKFVIGFALLHSSEPAFQFSGIDNTIPTTVNSQNTFVRTVMLNIQNTFDIEAAELAITPIILLRRSKSNVNFGTSTTGFRNNNNDFDLEIGSNILFKKLLIAGFHYKTFNPQTWGSAMFGVRLAETYQVTFSYDFVKSTYSDRYRNAELGFGFYL